jgi:hypothetical protein
MAKMRTFSETHKKFERKKIPPRLMAGLEVKLTIML